MTLHGTREGEAHERLYHGGMTAPRSVTALVALASERGWNSAARAFARQADQLLEIAWQSVTTGPGTTDRLDRQISVLLVDARAPDVVVRRMAHSLARIASDQILGTDVFLAGAETLLVAAAGLAVPLVRAEEGAPRDPDVMGVCVALGPTGAPPVWRVRHVSARSVALRLALGSGATLNTGPAWAGAGDWTPLRPVSPRLARRRLRTLFVTLFQESAQHDGAPRWLCTDRRRRSWDEPMAVCCNGLPAVAAAWIVLAEHGRMPPLRPRERAALRAVLGWPVPPNVSSDERVAEDAPLIGAAGAALDRMDLEQGVRPMAAAPGRTGRRI